MNAFKVFDSHVHIIDRRFPLVPNNGFLPNDFTCDDYLERTKSFRSVGGAIVSGSFQAFDQTYLIAALKELGSNYVGVTQLPVSVSAEEVIKLDGIGVRAVRFNLRRGGSEGINHLETLAKRVYDIAGWHVELYVDSGHLSDMCQVLSDLPAVSIDHLGLSKTGFDVLLKLVEKGVYVKATGFGRVDLNVEKAVKEICMANPNSLMFGTDLPSTRAPRVYRDSDLILLTEVLDDELAKKVLYENAVSFYRPRKVCSD